MKIMKNKNIAVAVLLLSSVSKVQAQVPQVLFYKGGKVIYTEMAKPGSNGERPVGDFEVLSAEEHPVKNHIEVKELNVTPCSSSDKDVSWQLNYKLRTDLLHGDRRFYLKVEPVLVGKPDVLELTQKDGELELCDTLPYLAKQTEYTFTFYEEAYGLTFKTDGMKVKTGYSQEDVMADYGVSKVMQTFDGTRYLLPASAVESFSQKHQLGAVSTYLQKYIEEYMTTCSEADVKKLSTEIAVYDGKLYLVTELPDAALAHIASVLDKPAELSGGDGIVPVSNGKPTMSVTEVSIGSPAKNFWEVIANAATAQSEILYNTQDLMPGKYVNLYVTMASGRGNNADVEESLPVSFTAECQVLNDAGKYIKAGIDVDGTPVTGNAYLCNQHPEWNCAVPDLEGQANFQRCYLVKNDAGRKVYLGTVKVDNLGPVQLTFKSFGPSSSKIREVVYTRILRIANVITEPFDTEEAAKAAIHDSGNEKQ